MDDFRSIRSSLLLLGAAAMLGWVVAGFRPAPDPVTVVEYQVVIREVPVVVEHVPTPIADSLVDWEGFEEQTDCLWELLQVTEVPITLEIVLAAGTWTDARGGACAVLEELQ